MESNEAETELDRPEQSLSPEELRAAILLEFASLPTPDASKIVDERGYTHLENEEIREAFRDKTWTDLSIPFLTYHRQAVFFFTPHAWSYYVPAYMHAVVSAFPDTDTMASELLATVRPTSDGRDELRRRARIDALNERQRELLLHFVNWLATVHPEEIDEDDRRAIVASIRRHRRGDRPPVR